MRYILLIALLLLAGSVAADTLYTQGITDADSVRRSNIMGTAFATYFTITDDAATSWTLDSASLRLYLRKSQAADHDTFKVWIYNSYATDTSLLDTSAWKGCWRPTGDRDSTVMFVFQLNDTVYQDSSYWFAAAGKDYAGSGYPAIVLDTNTEGFSVYYKGSQDVEVAPPAVMDSSSTWTQSTTASEDNMIFTLYGTSTSTEPGTSRVIYWGNATLGKGRHGCAD